MVNPTPLQRRRMLQDFCGLATPALLPATVLTHGKRHMPRVNAGLCGTVRVNPKS